MAKEKDNRIGKNDLGISKGTYALGNSAKDGLIWGTLATVAAYIVLAIGRKDGNAVDKIAHVLEGWHTGLKLHLLEKPSKWVATNIFRHKELNKHATGPTTTAVAAIFGAIVGKLVAIPSGHSGLKTAQAAVKRYDNLQNENNRLADENTQFQAMLARQNVSFAERIQKPETEVAAVNSR